MYTPLGTREGMGETGPCGLCGPGDWTLGEGGEGIGAVGLSEPAPDISAALHAAESKSSPEDPSSDDSALSMHPLESQSPVLSW